MAYNFIPTTAKEISDTVKDKTIANEITALLLQLQASYAMFQDPLAIDPAAPKTVKITRKLTTKLDLSKLSKQYPHIKISFGEGSRGGRGTQNKGNLFEYELAEDINRWWKGEKISSEENAALINDLISTYGIDKWPKMNK